MNANTNGIIEYIQRMIANGIANDATQIIRHDMSNGTTRFAIVMDAEWTTELFDGGKTRIAELQLCHVDVAFIPTPNGDNVSIRLYSDPTDYIDAPCTLHDEIFIDAESPNYALIGRVAKIVADYLTCY
jgi:hypothetical protein